MNFSWALAKVKKEIRIKRNTEKWVERFVELDFEHTCLLENFEGTYRDRWYPTQEDMLADDWMIIGVNRKFREHVNKLGGSLK